MRVRWLLALALLGGASAWSGSAQAGAGVTDATQESFAPIIAGEERVLTGEVVAVWCVLGEGSFGIGRSYANKARNCIRLGSPIALKVGPVFYLVTNDDRAMTARLTDWAGHLVMARGTITRQDGHLGISIAHVERTRPP
jgi:hypothetical protein